MGQILILEGCDSNQVGWNWDQVEQNQDGPASLGFCWVKGDLCGGEACGGGTSCAGGNSDDRGDHVGRVRGDIVKDDSEEDREDTGRGGVLGGEACEGVGGESREEGEGDAHNEVETCKTRTENSGTLITATIKREPLFKGTQPKSPSPHYTTHSMEEKAGSLGLLHTHTQVGSCKEHPQFNG